MPTYQYACTECRHAFEAVQSFTDDPLTECPACSGRLRKVFNSVGIVFKGSGFYRNDSRQGGSRDAEKPADKGDSKSDKSATASDAKPPSPSGGAKPESSSKKSDTSSSSSTAGSAA